MGFMGKVPLLKEVGQRRYDDERTYAIGDPAVVLADLPLLSCSDRRALPATVAIDVVLASQVLARCRAR